MTICSIISAASFSVPPGAELRRDGLLDTVWRGRDAGELRQRKLGQNDKAAVIAKDLLDVEVELAIAGFFTRIPFPRDAMAIDDDKILRAARVPESICAEKLQPVADFEGTQRRARL